MPETNKREVNADKEVLNLEDDSTKEPEGTEEDDDLDEDVISEDQIPKEGETPAEEGEKPKAEEDSKEEEPKEAASAESSPEEQSEGEKPAESVPSQQPAPVAGESPREKALRLEVQRVKGLLRKKSVSDLVDNPRAEPGAAAASVVKLKEMGYTDEEIKNMETAVDLIASSKGYVKQSQTYQNVVNEEVDAFIKANPEYDPKNDLEDVRWESFQRHLTGSGIYNINGKTREQLQVIFRKVKADVDAELGEPASTTKAKADEETKRKEAAQRQKIKSVSHSGGTKTASEKTRAPVDPEVRKMFKGFDDKDLE